MNENSKFDSKTVPARLVLQKCLKNGTSIHPALVVCAYYQWREILSKHRIELIHLQKQLQTIWQSAGRILVKTASSLKDNLDWAEGDTERSIPTDDEDTIAHEAHQILSSLIWKMVVSALGVGLALIGLFLIGFYQVDLVSPIWKHLLSLDSFATDESIRFDLHTLRFGIVIVSGCFFLWARHNKAHPLYQGFVGMTAVLSLVYAIGIGATLGSDSYADKRQDEAAMEIIIADPDVNGGAVATSENDEFSLTQSLLDFLSNFFFFGIIVYSLASILVIHWLLSVIESQSKKILTCYEMWRIDITEWLVFTKGVQGAKDAELEIQLVDEELDGQLPETVAAELFGDVQQEISSKLAELAELRSVPEEAVEAEPDMNFEPNKLQAKVPPIKKVVPLKRDQAAIATLEKEIARLEKLDYQFFMDCMTDGKEPTVSDVSNPISNIEGVA